MAEYDTLTLKVGLEHLDLDGIDEAISDLSRQWARAWSRVRKS